MRSRPSPRVRLTCCVLWLAATVAISLPKPGGGAVLGPTCDVASGDVTDRSAVVWGRAGRSAQMRVELSRSPDFRRTRLGGAASTVEATDYTARVYLHGLRPGTRYYFRVSFDGGEAVIGTFATAPRRREMHPVRFVWGGDLGGQRYCRRSDGGYTIFQRIGVLEPDFFVANGDMIYADGTCPEEGPDGPGGWENVPGDFPGISDAAVDWTDVGAVREVYRKHWHYNRADAAFQQFLRRTPIYAQWDDHEVIDDFGALWTSWNALSASRAGYPNLVAAGRDAFFDYSPIARRRDDPNRIYRRFVWGRGLELLILDARSYRSRNDLPDGPDKTLLGKAQLRWLKRSLRRSRATWKVVASDVPMSIPTGTLPAVFGRDGWASGTLPDRSSRTGFEHELRDLLGYIDAHRIRNIVFVTTDAHWATSIRYEVDVDGDGDSVRFHELVTGPLSAIALQPVSLDPTFNPVTLYAEGGIFNFGYARLERQADGKVHFLADVRGEDGLPRPGSSIDLAPE